MLTLRLGKDLGPEDNDNFSYTSKGKRSFTAAIPYCVPDWTCNIHYVRTNVHYVVQWYITQYRNKNEEKHWVIVIGLGLEYIRVVYKTNFEKGWDYGKELESEW